MQEWRNDAGQDVEARANAWLARYAPLVMDAPVAPTKAEVLERLDTLAELRREGPDLCSSSRNLIGPDAPRLVTTLQRATESLDGIDRELRQQLAALEPGDPRGIVDLDALQDEIAVRQARSEIGFLANEEVPPVLELTSSPGNPAAAGGMAVFAFGWLSFTTFHMVLMIGGMSRAFGWAALGLLGFYGIFYAAGLAMAVGAFTAAARESVRIEGRRLEVEQRFLGVSRRRRYVLAPGARAEVGRPTMVQSNSKSPTNMAVMLADELGRTVTIGASPLSRQTQQLADRINAYLAVHGRD